MSFNLTTEELEVRALAKDFTEREVVPLIEMAEKEHRTPHEALKKLGDIGFLGMFIPAKYGGGESSILAHLITLEEMAHTGIGTESLAGMGNSVPYILLNYGSEEVKEKYIPPICRGDVCCAQMFTEPETGSDARMIKTTATPDGDYYLLNGTKRFATWGAWDGPAIIHAKDETGRVSSFVMEKNVEGYTTDPPYEKMGLTGLETVDVYLENVRIPKGNLLGEKAQALRILLPWVSFEKIQQSARLVGIGEAALEESVKYAKERKLRNGRQADLQGIQWMLADMKTKIEAARWLTYKCGNLMEEGDPEWIMMAALDKNFTIPTILDVCRLGMQIHSAYGYTKDFAIERLYRAAIEGLGVVVSLEINKSIIGGTLVRD